MKRAFKERRKIPNAARAIRKLFKINRTDCIHWEGKKNTDGYGMLRSSRTVQVYVHRVVYELFFGPIQKGLVVDHKCRTRDCSNPYHLRIVTPAVNSKENSISPMALNARKTHCNHGHEFTKSNTIKYVGRNGKEHRRCRACTS